VDALAVQIGSRPAGSATYDQAVQYATDQLRQWGYQPSLQSFPVQTYDDRGSQVEVTSAAPTLHLAADTLTYSIGGQVEAPLLAGGPVTLRLAVDASTEQRSATNVVAELPGSRADAGVVIFGAHLDTVPAGPGANDNGSGSAVVLELARELAQRGPAERPLTV